MGIRIHPNTWREPLRLIDSWLSSPSPKPIAVTVRDLPQQLRRFARAGWLGKDLLQPANKTLAACEPIPQALIPSQQQRVRIKHATTVHSHNRARLVISGNMADVCAELERLAALEQQEKMSWI